MNARNLRRAGEAVLAGAALLLLGALLAACGGGSASSETGMSSSMGDTSMEGMSSEEMEGMSEGASMSMTMTPLASTKAGGEEISLTAMAPQTFYVPAGEGLRKQAPAGDDNAHMMVTVADDQTGVRLPDATVTLTVEGPSGKTTFDGPLYEMIGKGMGLHYGENVALAEPGTYTATVIVGAPQVARHANLKNDWRKPEKVQEKFKWNGTSVEASA